MPRGYHCRKSNVTEYVVISFGRAARIRIRRISVGLATSLALSACGASPHALVSEKIDAVPSSSIAAPLTASGCALQQCWAVGTTTVQGVTSTLVEQRSADGQWTSVSAPTVNGEFNATACGDTGCFFGGSSDGHDLLWSTSNDTGAVSPVTIADGVGIAALACTPTLCLAVDRTATGEVRLVNVADGTANTVTGLTNGDTVTSLSCATATQCWVAYTNAAGSAALVTTTDGSTWTPLSLPAWVSITSLSCASACLALVSDGQADYLAREKSASWDTVRMPFAATAMSCPSTGHCAVVGHHRDESGAAVLWQSGHLQPIILHYAPTPLTAVGCSATDCAAVGSTTLVSLRP